VKLDWPGIVNLRLDPFEKMGIGESHGGSRAQAAAGRRACDPGETEQAANFGVERSANRVVVFAVGCPLMPSVSCLRSIKKELLP